MWAPHRPESAPSGAAVSSSVFCTFCDVEGEEMLNNGKRQISPVSGFNVSAVLLFSVGHTDLLSDISDIISNR